jgi:hypothetical protein
MLSYIHALHLHEDDQNFLAPCLSIFSARSVHYSFYLSLSLYLSLGLGVVRILCARLQVEKTAGINRSALISLSAHVETEHLRSRTKKQ